MRERDSRKYFAFVEGTVEPTEGEPGTRLGLTLDCIEIGAFVEGRSEDREALALVRVLSTPKRLEALFALPKMPKEGDWLEIELSDISNRPLSWLLSASNDYRGPAKPLRLIAMRYVPSGDAADFPVSHAGNGFGVRAESLIARFAASPSDRGGDRADFEALFAQQASKPTPFPRVLDVGQASCVSLYSERHVDADVLGYFDVGAPLWFHHSSMPKVSPLKLPAKDGFVFLSHWDFDHYALALWRHPQLRDLRWYAPYQAVGPNGALFRKQLGAKLHYLERPSYGLDGFRLIQGCGALNGVPDDRNATGYMLRVEHDDGARLLTADVGYEHIPADALESVVAITIPHHGGSGGGTPPAPSSELGVAVASYGLPNKYRHPNEDFLSAHDAAGWLVQRTAGHGLVLRGSYWL